MILTTTGVYTYDFTTGEVAADPRLNIKKGELIRDNHGDYWIYNHTGASPMWLPQPVKVKISS